MNADSKRKLLHKRNPQNLAAVDEQRAQNSILLLTAGTGRPARLSTASGLLAKNGAAMTTPCKRRHHGIVGHVITDRIRVQIVV
jgi:hypothetical protein